jgi:hypothetical protein
MSQHRFSTQYQGRGVQVILGHDRPLGHFFLTVTYAQDDTTVYSYLADPAGGFNQHLDYYRAKLSSLGIIVPESMFRETRQDAIDGGRNRLVQHHNDDRLETVFDAS